jgi:hypothetical protein
MEFQAHGSAHIGNAATFSSIDGRIPCILASSINVLFSHFSEAPMGQNKEIP